jgi:hypothetical protein
MDCHNHRAEIEACRRRADHHRELVELTMCMPMEEWTEADIQRVVYLAHLHQRDDDLAAHTLKLLGGLGKGQLVLL